MLGIHILYLCFIASLLHNNYWRLNNRAMKLSHIGQNLNLNIVKKRTNEFLLIAL